MSFLYNTVVVDKIRVIFFSPTKHLVTVYTLAVILRQGKMQRDSSYLLGALLTFCFKVRIRVQRRF